jgi:hypothetical protein
MMIATIILVLGKSLYVFKPPQGNITAQVCGGIWVNHISLYSQLPMQLKAYIWREITSKKMQTMD